VSSRPWSIAHPTGTEDERARPVEVDHDVSVLAVTALFVGTMATVAPAASAQSAKSATSPPPLISDAPTKPPPELVFTGDLADV